MTAARDETEAALLAEIEARRGEIVEFLQGFLREATPNPPGDTRGAAEHIRRFLDALPAGFQVGCVMCLHWHSPWVVGQRIARRRVYRPARKALPPPR